MKFAFPLDGTARCLYTEEVDLASLGHLLVVRASHVEPEPSGSWFADLSPVGGPTLGPFPARSEALRAEIDWINIHLSEIA